MSNVICFGQYSGISFSQLINYTMLYDEGDECEDVTGGWGITKTVPPYDDQYPLFYPPQKLSDSIKLACSGKKCISYSYPKNVLGLSEYAYVFLKGVTTNFVSENYNYEDQGYPVVRQFTANWIYANPDTTANCGAKTVGQVSIGRMKLNKSSNDYRFVIHTCGLIYQVDSVESYLNNFWAVKEDNWQQWVTYGGLDPSSFTNLDELLADTASLTVLFNNKTAANFLLKQCTGTVMCGIFGSDTAWGAIPTNLKSLMAGNIHWTKFANIYDRSLS